MHCVLVPWVFSECLRQVSVREWLKTGSVCTDIINIDAILNFKLHSSDRVNYVKTEPVNNGILFITEKLFGHK